MVGLWRKQMIQLKRKFQNCDLKDSTDEWEQSVSETKFESDGTVPNSENYTDDPNGR